VRKTIQERTERIIRMREARENARKSIKEKKEQLRKRGIKVY